MPKKKRKDATSEKNGEQRRQSVQRNTAGPSSARNVVRVMEPNPDVNNIPLNKTGTFIEKIFVSCSFCSQRFDRPDEYYLHHAEKHAKIYGHLPESDVNKAKDSSGNKEHVENTNIYSSERKRRRSVYLNEVCENSETSELSDNETSKVANIDNEPDKNSTMNSNNTESTRKLKRKSSKTKQESDSVSSDGDSDSHIRHALNKFVRKLNKSLQKFKSKTKRRIQYKRRLVYKCKVCSLHFLKESEWRKHLRHPVNPSKCKHCMLKFSDKSLEKHQKMHEKDGQTQKKLKFHIVTDKSYSSSENSSDSSSSESSESDDEENKTDQASKPELSKTGVVEPTITEKEIKTNTNDNIPITSNNQDKTKKKYKVKLFKCDDCEEHFLTRNSLKLHTNNSTHYYRMDKKNTQCNICTIKFSGINTLLRHRRLHHNSRLNLTKEDFLIITSTKFGRKLPDRERLTNSRNEARKEFQIDKLILNHNPNTSVDSVGDQITMYRCEGCILHFMNYTTWNRHLNEPKCHKIKTTNVKKCPHCEVYFTNKIWNDHMKIHKENPSVTKNNFKILSREPRKAKFVAIPQSDVVSTTATDLGSVNNAPRAAIDFSLNHSTGEDVSNAESCKVKLAKSTGAGLDNWRIVTNRTEDANTPHAEPTDDMGYRNINQDPEYVHDINEKQSNLVEFTVDNNNVNVSNNFSKANVQVTNAKENTKANENQIPSLENDRNRSFGDNIMVDIPSSLDISNKKTQFESLNQFIVTSADTTTDNIANDNEVVPKTHYNNQEFSQHKTQDEISGTDVRNENITVDQTITHKMIDHQIHTDHSKPSIKNDFIKVEIKIKNKEPEIDNSMVNVNCKENIKTDSSNLGEEGSQLKKEPYGDKKQIKLEHVASQNERAIQNIHYVNEEIKAEKLMVNNEQDIKIEYNKDIENRNVVSENVTDIKDKPFKEEMKTENNELESEINSSFSHHIKISNCYSMGLKFEEPTSSCIAIENELNTGDFPDKADIKHESENPQSAHVDVDESCSLNHEVDKIQQKNIGGIEYYSDDSQATLILETFNGTTYEQTCLKSDCNDAGIIQTISSLNNENNTETQNVTNQEHNEVLRDSFVENYATQETITSNENTLHVTVRQEGGPSTSNSFGEGGSEFHVRDRSEVKDSDEFVVFDSMRIKNEEAEETRARNRQPSNTREGDTDNQQDIIDLVNDCDEDDDVVLVPQISATIDLVPKVVASFDLT